MVTDPPRVNRVRLPCGCSFRAPDPTRRALVWPRSSWASKPPPADWKPYSRKPRPKKTDAAWMAFATYMGASVGALGEGLALVRRGRVEEARGLFALMDPEGARELVDELVSWVCEERAYDDAAPFVFALYDLLNELALGVVCAFDAWEGEQECLDARKRAWEARCGAGADVGACSIEGGGAESAPLILSAQVFSPVPDGIEQSGHTSSQEGQA